MTASLDHTAKICGLKTVGTWVEKAIIPHLGVVESATFSVDGCLVVTTSSDGKEKIYGQDTFGSWVEKAIVTHRHRDSTEVNRLCTNGHHLVAPFNDNSVIINH
ncbi:hypothetical protein P6910_15875 [Endozoicomonas sp. 8E]|nr:hypothetical protein [Endozoicomonas sp. 8E]WOG26047.1 hypothetical protein P6910_15875 [Endozoicomonas sp. 8E]